MADDNYGGLTEAYRITKLTAYKATALTVLANHEATRGKDLSSAAVIALTAAMITAQATLEATATIEDALKALKREA